MGFKKVIVILTITVAMLSYWLYDPLPPGYSLESRVKYQAMVTGTKLFPIVAWIGSLLGFGSFSELSRNITGRIVKDFGPKGDLKGVTTSDTVFDGIPVRVYEPTDSQNKILPGIVYYHGGGFVFGSVDTVDVIARRLCKDTQSVVVSVEYRLAPEFPFPAAIEDSAAATKYFLSNAADFNVDAKRIAVAGDSAGGNLAATVSLKLREEKFPIPIKLQVLIYPWTQSLDFELPSMAQNRYGPLLARDEMPVFAALYTEGKNGRIADYTANRHVIKSFREKISKTFLNLEKLPKEFLKGYEKPVYPEGDENIWNEVKNTLLNRFHSPLTAENLENLPEAFVLIANHDALRDEGYLYGIRLKEAKNKVTLYIAEIGFHGVANFIEALPEADEIFSEVTKFLKAKL